MRVLTYSGYRNISFLRQGGSMWPVANHLVASKFFYGVIDTSKEYENEAESITMYENPDIYWQVKMEKPHQDDYSESENPEEEYNKAMEEYSQKLLEFKENNKGWYENRREMAKDMSSYVLKHRKKIGAKDTYPADGYEARALSNVFEIDNNIMLQ